jgi:hypothetical protein
LCLLNTCFFPGDVSADKGVPAAVVEGRLVTAGGLPMGQARVAIFRAESSCPPDTRGINRVPEAVAQAGPGGDFLFAISPGDYFMGAAGLSSLAGNAMMLDNKEFYLALDNNGAARKFSFVPGEEKILGSVVMTANDRNGSDEKCFKVRGVVTDGKGRPMVDMVVMAKADFNELRPRFVSHPTKIDGHYEIGLSPGNYILIAREQDRSFGRPAPGDLLGVFGEIKSVGIGGGFNNSADPKRVIEGAAGDSFIEKDIKMFIIPDPEKIKLERQEQ